MQCCDPLVEKHAATMSEACWTRLSGKSYVQLYCRLHNDLCNVPLFLLPGVRRKRSGPASTWWTSLAIQRPLSNFSTRTFWSDTSILTRSSWRLAVTPWPRFLARYNLTRIDLKTFTFSAGSKSPSIANAVLGPSLNACCSQWLWTLISLANWTTTCTNLGTTTTTFFDFCERETCA